MLPVVLMFVVMSLVFTILGIPLAIKRVPPNRIYGFRTPRTLSSPDIWYPMNAYGGRALIVFGLVELAFSVVSGFIPGITEDAYAFVNVGVLIAGMVVILVQCAKYLRKIDG